MSQRLRLGLVALAAFALVLVLAAATGLRRALSAPAAASPEVLFTVEPGASLSRVAHGLEELGLVRSATAFAWLARYRGVAGGLRAGEYRLSATLPAGKILDRIARGEIATHELVVPEGFTAEQIAARLEASGFVDADAFASVVRDPATARELGVEGDTLEGYLFPETYRLPRGLAPRAIARVLVEQFLRVWGEIEPRARKRGLSMREVVTLASIVEKETGVPEERPLIAAVFHNRLARGMRLETDPAVIYGIPDFDGNLRRRDLENPDNPYNTYQLPGLPPGPIASPGAASLRAVVEPADSDALFFVSRNDGTHVFSRTYREHVRQVNRYQKPGAR